MRRPALPFVLIALALTAAAAEEAAAPSSPAHWPNWRGPLFSGVAPQGDPPVEWSESKNVRFKVELPGPGHATPVVWGDRIYVLSAVSAERAPERAPTAGSREAGAGLAQALPATQVAAQQQPPEPPAERPGSAPAAPARPGMPPREKPTRVHRFVVSAHDRATGETLWATTVREEIPHEPGHETGSQASASPVTDGEHVWAFFGSRGLYCLDREGRIVWEVDLGDMQTRNEFGEGASPALHGDTLVVNWDHEGDSFLVALDKRTGRQRWKVARDEPTSWSTPFVVRDGDRPLVVVSATRRVRAYDLATGEEVWSVAGLGLNCIPTPVEHGGMLFVMSGYRDPAGMAIRYQGARGDLDGGERVAWRLDRGLSYVPSPLLYDGQLYLIERFRGVLSRHDLATGEASWTDQRLEGMGNVYASPLGAAGRIYVLGRDGAAVVLRHAERFEMLARNALDDFFDASPIAVGDTLYLRGHRHLYAIAAP